jgi:hypothetical protein
MVDFFKKGCLETEYLKIDYMTFVDKSRPPGMNFLKPSIMLKSISDYPEESDFIFLDSDVTIGKRFDPFKFEGIGMDFPLSPFGPYEIPYTFRSFDNGITETYTPDILMEYFNVNSKSMRYVQNCMILYGRQNLDFILEWESICLNKYLLKQHWRYFSFQDETAFNVLLWKYNCNKNLGHCFVNTHKYSTFFMVENSSVSNINIDDNPYEYCYSSSDVMFYHGTKDKEENVKIQKYIYENYAHNTRTNTYPS